MSSQVVHVSTFSKTSSMTGLRFWLCLSRRALGREESNVIHRTFNGALNTSVQDAALTALQTLASDVRALSYSYQERRDRTTAVLSEIPAQKAVPQGACYALPRCASPLSPMSWWIDSLGGAG
ncbi:aminotransferase class I/II-fold pyridoxal phosphate-dependent enzyme [Paenarthrobacter sp. YAF11_1]|uniref:aminotransferase class I/II-fold pyridoxal phosphate-dependent enzyme n=1 Tax=Paenarthrobacter sp. YAF11_1 TaxID=3233074 RepID=UPI003F9446B2